jgi:hypothetical protein
MHKNIDLQYERCLNQKYIELKINKKLKSHFRDEQLLLLLPYSIIEENNKK